MNKVVLVHYGELILKGKNRKWFEGHLAKNITTALRDFPVTIKRDYGRMVISDADSSQSVIAENEAGIQAALAQVFGIAKFYIGVEVVSRYENIEQEVLRQLDAMDFETFGIRTKRSSKDFPLRSGDIDRQVGAAVVETMHKKVDLTAPDVWVSIRIQGATTIIATQVHEGAGGLPYATSGKMLSLLSSGIDSPVASHMMMRRGATITYLHFHSYPLTTKASIENVQEIVSTLHKYQPHAELLLAPLADIQKEIASKTPSRFRVLLYRRAMFQIAQRLAHRVGAKALVTGESLGQVASQTIENMTAATHGIELPVLRPLVGIDKEQIIQHARAINTYDTSIQPYEDCCSLLVPDSVETRANLKELLEAEQSIAEWDALIEKTIEGVESIKGI